MHRVLRCLRHWTNPAPRALACSLLLATATALAEGRGAAREARQTEPDLERAQQALARDAAEPGLDPARLAPEPLGESVLRPAHRQLHRPAARSEGPATLTGTVRDASGAVVPSVTVQVVSPHFHEPPSTTTDEKGSFRLDGVPPGPVTVQFRLTGFKVSRVSLRLEPGELRRHRPRFETGRPGDAIAMTESPRDRLLPQSVVPLGVQLTPEDFRPVLVYLHPREAYSVWAEPIEPGVRLPLSREEFEDASRELQDFYATALDLSAGAPRFLSYVSEDLLETWREIARHNAGQEIPDPSLPPHGLTDDQLRLRIAEWLEFAVVEHLGRLEGLPEPERLEQAEAGDGRRALLGQTAYVREELTRLGALDAAHLAEVAPYLRRLLGEGLLAKQRLQVDYTGERRDLGEVYLTLLPPLYLYFGERDGRLRLVHLLVGD